MIQPRGGPIARPCALRRAAAGVCAFSLTIGVAGCLTSRVVETRDGRPWEITTERFLGLLTVATDERPVPTQAAKARASLRRPLVWLNWAGILALTAGVILAVAFRAPAIQGIGGTVALAGGVAWGIAYLGLYALAAQWWILGLAIVAGGGLIYGARRHGLDQWIKNRLTRAAESGIKKA